NGSQAQVERARVRGLDRIGGRLRDGLFDVAEESDSEVQAVGRRPPKLRRHRCARGQKHIELLPLRFRQRQPEKRPDLYARFDQCEGAQAPGALGRQPNCELTESIPAARFGVSAILISSGVTGGSFMTASRAIAPGVSTAAGNFNFVFFSLRACR